MNVTDWTDQDSRNLDAEIRRQCPNRQPLRRDPTIAGILEELAIECSGNNDTCTQCRCLMWRGRTVPDGYAKHIARGLCSNCYSRRSSKKSRPVSRLDANAIREIGSLRDDGWRVADIARIFNVTARTIHRALTKLEAFSGIDSDAKAAS